MGKIIPFPSRPAAIPKEHPERSQGQAVRPLHPKGSRAAGRGAFQSFVDYVDRGDYRSAADSLRQLLDLTPDLAEKSAMHFAKVYESENTFKQRVLGLLETVSRDDPNEALMLLYACFGLQITEAIDVLHFLKTDQR